MPTSDENFMVNNMWQIIKTKKLTHEKVLCSFFYSAGFYYCRL
jgi:hypothetical protein